MWRQTYYRRLSIPTTRMATNTISTCWFTDKGTNYNKTLSSTKVAIERAYGLLKGPFKQLQHINVAGLEQTCNIIMSCCVLHNLCIRQGDILPEYFVNNDDQQDALGNVAGVFKRNQIAHRLLHPGTNIA